MHKLKRTIIFVFLFAVALLVLLFTMDNRQAVSLKLMGQATPELPLALFVLVVFVLGMVVGFAINWWRNKCLEVRCRKQAKQIEQLKEKSAQQQVAVTAGA